MAHVSLTRNEIATLIYMVEQGSYLHQKLSIEFGSESRKGLLYLSTREIVLEGTGTGSRKNLELPEDRFGVKRVELKMVDGYVKVCVF